MPHAQAGHEGTRVTVARDEELEWFATLGDLLRVERVDGVPVVHVGAPGPVRAGLTFRVGTADETLPQRGLTHLVEHLALHGQASPAEHRNGMTGTTITQFVIAGSEQQAVAFLNHVCEALRELPIDRLDAERSILGVEAQGHRVPMDANIMEVRYGASSFGNVGYREFGAETSTAAQVVDWARRWFVRGNAVAWITTDNIPHGLDLRLPEGGRQTLVLPPSALVERPAWFTGPTGNAIVEAVVPRSTAAVMFAGVVSRALFRQLRIEHGYSYTATAQYEPLDADSARVLVYADAAPDTTAEMVGALADALGALRDGKFDPTDVADAREQGLESARQGRDAPDLMLQSATFSFLLGGESWHPDDLAAKRDAVTEADLAAVARGFWEDAIWQTPSAPDRAGGVAEVRRQIRPAVEGRSYFHATTGERFVFGEDGVSVVASNDTATVLFRECVLALQWADGGRVLVGRDALTLSIEPPTLKLFSAQELAVLDAAVPADSIVRLTRASESIPRGPVVRTPGLSPLWLIAAGFLLLVAWRGVALAMSSTASVGQLNEYGHVISASSAVTPWGIVVAGLGGAIALVWGWLRRVWWKRKQRKGALS